MTIFCCICRGDVPTKRSNRGSHFCSEPCHEAYRRERRTWKASVECRLCGRPPIRPRKKKAIADAVRTAHNGPEKLMDGNI